MTIEERFAVWAPAESVWSQWVAPVVFAQIDCGDEALGRTPPAAVEWLKIDDRKTAIIADIKGAAAIEFGIALAQRGYRPVLIVNASPSPHQIVRFHLTPTDFTDSVINMGPMLDAVCDATPLLQSLSLPAEAPPVFVLDALRSQGTNRSVDKRLFDNRWLVFPQDFPSASFIKSQGIERIILIQNNMLHPQDDLAHVLLRWQENGIQILATTIESQAAPQEITVGRPWRFKAAWYRVLAILGLRRNSGGGFGGYIPDTTGIG